MNLANRLRQLEKLQGPAAESREAGNPADQLARHRQFGEWLRARPDASELIDDMRQRQIRYLAECNGGRRPPMSLQELRDHNERSDLWRQFERECPA